jgi:hypothetical protein
VPSDNAVVVEPQQRDHVADICLILDPAGAKARLAGEHRVVVDAPLLEQIGPDLFRKAEVGGVVAVEVTDLPAAELEGELAPVARPRRDAWSGGDLGDDLLACCLCLRHETSP